MEMDTYEQGVVVDGRKLEIHCDKVSLQPYKQPSLYVKQIKSKAELERVIQSFDVLGKLYTIEKVELVNDKEYPELKFAWWVREV